MNDHKERAAFTISKALKAELEDVVPASKRSRFVEQAIADALLREARKRALDALDTLPSYGTKGEDSVDVLRRIRQGRDSEIALRHRVAAA
ncbi:hypothetical protein [Rhizobium sp. C4]|uniref:hypothetical protein n=1 Tax=Rhizobium sp. C4 TaxID=1349800 RepID=UPI001E4C23D7|nr:hypothetical protein [Rhizobium sp. C4]MCD2174154.1 hypothetical protein [Rhizobium sp. C4]